MHEWLDKYIAEQAAYYNVSVATFVVAMETLAEAQEQHEREN
jgi:hypothetical protein